MLVLVLVLVLVLILILVLYYAIVYFTQWSPYPYICSARLRLSGGTLRAVAKVVITLT